jgi:hypothetical protein
MKKMEYIAKMLSGFLLLISCQGSAHAQWPKPMNDIDSLAFLIKDTYVDYRYRVKDGEFDALVRRVKRQRSKDSFALLSQLTAFFKDNHLLLWDYKIGNRKIDTAQCRRDSLMIKRYFAGKKAKDRYEGYWRNDRNHLLVALKKVNTNPLTYRGYVVESTTKVRPGFCQFTMVQQKDGSYLVDYTAGNMNWRLFQHAKFKNNNVLWINSFGGKWIREPRYQPGTLDRKTEFQYEMAFKVLDDTTVYLKMTNFGDEQIPRYDSMVKHHAEQISKAHTLIVDIRNNTGGRIRNYFPLFPYAYTNPIVHCGVYVRYSDALIKSYRAQAHAFLAKGDTASAKIYRNWADTLQATLKDSIVYYPADTLAQDLPVLDKPKRIGIITNNLCMSAAELMLMNFKQSKKVAFFGETTGGVVDNLVTVDIPVAANKYSLFIAISKRATTASNPSYDGVGIPPDVAIDDYEEDWVGFVRRYYAGGRLP